MTYAHFLVCVTLTLLPPWVVYKSKLGEYSVAPNVGMSAMAHALTQLVKIFLMATFIGPSSGETFDLSQEILKTIISSIDIIGIYLILNAKALQGDKDIKILSVGLGWNYGEVITSKLLPLWIGATQLEFSWKFIQMAILSNINMILYVSFSCLVFVYSRKQVETSTKTLITFSLLFFISLNLIHGFFDHFKIDTWIVLIAQLFFSIILYFLSNISYQTLIKNK
eukprot:gene7192-11508_t